MSMSPTLTKLMSEKTTSQVVTKAFHNADANDLYGGVAETSSGFKTLRLS